MEEASWFIWPAGTDAAVIITVSWRERMFTTADTTIADDMARNCQGLARGRGDDR
jgi:hypothetical protein